MDAASGIFATLSLSIQLVQTLKQAKAFLKDVQNAPDELARLVESVHQLDLVLTGVQIFAERQRDLGDFPGALGLVQGTLQICESNFKRLDKFVKKLQVAFVRQGRVQKLWASVRPVVKKDEIMICAMISMRVSQAYRLQCYLTCLTSSNITNAHLVAKLIDY